MRRDIRLVPEPDARRRVRAHDRQWILCRKARQIVLEGQRAEIHRAAAGLADAGNDAVERLAERHSLPLEVESGQRLVVVELAGDGRFTDEHFRQPARVELRDVVAEAGRRGLRISYHRPVAHQSPNHRRVAGFCHPAQEAFVVGNLVSGDLSRCQKLALIPSV